MARPDSMPSDATAPLAARMTRRHLLRVGMFALAAVPLAVACSPTPPANPTAAPKTDAKPSEAAPTAAAQTGAAPAKPAEAPKPAEAAKPTAAAQAPAASGQAVVVQGSPGLGPDGEGRQAAAGREAPARESLVVQPIEEIGQYGGTWRRAFKGAGRLPRLSAAPSTSRCCAGRATRRARSARAWPRSGSSRRTAHQLTLTLRKGLKWSDGEPFTTDDILFWWKDIALDTNLTPTPPPEWVVDGKPMTVEKVSAEVSPAQVRRRRTAWLCGCWRSTATSGR